MSCLRSRIKITLRARIGGRCVLKARVVAVVSIGEAVAHRCGSLRVAYAVRAPGLRRLRHGITLVAVEFVVTIR